MEVRAVMIEYVPERAVLRLTVPGAERVVEIERPQFEAAEAAVRVVRRLLHMGEMESPAAPNWAIAAGRVWHEPHRYGAVVVAGDVPELVDA